MIKNIHELTAEELASIISQAKSVKSICAILKTNQKELYRKRKKFGLLDIPFGSKVGNDGIEFKYELPGETAHEHLSRRYPERMKDIPVEDFTRKDRNTSVNEEKKLSEKQLRDINSLLYKFKDKDEINHFVVSDMQIHEGVDTSHFHAISCEIIDRKPDVIVFLGDFYDMRSLYEATYDTFRSHDYKKDILVGYKALKKLLDPVIAKFDSNWKPRLVYCIGNHENRIVKLAQSVRLDGLIGLDDLKLQEFGFEVYPFLEPAIIDEIAYCHYFSTGAMNKPVASAKQLLTRKLMNCVQGHRQSFEIHREVRADGQPMYAIFAGSSYIHDEDYLGKQGNHYMRLVWALNNVNNMNFDPEMLPISRLMKKWGTQ